MSDSPLVSSTTPLVNTGRSARREKIVSAAEAVRLIRDGNTIATGGFVGIGFAEEIALAVCTEILIRIDWLTESPNVSGQCSHCSASSWLFWPRHSSRRADLRQRMRFSDIS